MCTKPATNIHLRGQVYQLLWISYRITGPKTDIKDIRSTKMCPSQSRRGIMLKSACNIVPLTSHFYIVKLGFTGVYFFFCSITKIMGTHIPTIYVLSKLRKKCHIFASDNCHF